jgi:hypothetical protein
MLFVRLLGMAYYNNFHSLLYSVDGGISDGIAI